MLDNASNVRKTPIQGRSRETVSAILEAAAQVLEARGYAGTTTNHIADRAGVSIGSLYQYFPNKESIVLSLMEAHMAEAASGTDALMSRVETRGCITPDDVREFVQLAMELHKREPGVHRAIVQDIPITGKIWWEAFMNMERIMADRLQVLLDKTPGARKTKGGAAARMIIRVLESLTHRQVMDSADRLDQKEFLEETTDMLCRYIFNADRDKS
ncbi:TetR/AcrR family transcriptional regulator [Desulfatibacillum aliphaticivorans]|uniref:TetR/AcrR family transcriptional regulator n=1 Tax=Desulfatibacillum aliphaticivorans TaxID=218208 RepID=UPI000417B256|nr:TetR/AcrR family transcriptional regulator [Desulfatibacillum aliphaticivorans]